MLLPYEAIFICQWLISPTRSFCQISPFGLGSIRRFPHDVSDMRQRAAWHFENVLQVSGHQYQSILNFNLLP